MVQGAKLRTAVNAVYKNGISLFDNKEIAADCGLTSRPDTNISVVTLRFAMAKSAADQFLHALQTGESEINIEGVANQS